MSNYRNNWKLCKSHENCAKCKKCVNDWKRKAQKHSSNASSLKYVLMCLMNNNTEHVEMDDDSEMMPTLTITEKRGESKWRKCGICCEKMTYGGDHNMVVFPCGHTTCITCYNTPQFREKGQCPYCRKDIKKAYALWGDEQEEEEEVE